MTYSVVIDDSRRLNGQPIILSCSRVDSEPRRKNTTPAKRFVKVGVRTFVLPGYLPSDTNPSQKTITVDICALVTVSIRSYGVTGVK